jgi:hypothetical protein
MVIGDTLGGSRRPPLVALALGVVAAGGIVVLVLALGGWAFEYRQFTMHDGRLKRLVERHPTVAAVTQGLLDEPGTRAIAIPATEPQLRALIAAWAPARVDEVVAKAQRWPSVRGFAAGEMIYLLFFDAGGRLQDYVLLST